MKTCAHLPMLLAAALTATALLSPVAGMATPRVAATLAALDPREEQAAARDRGEGQAFSMSGRVESVDYAQNIVVVRSHGDVYTIAITPTTSFEHAGQIGSISDLRPGVHVRIKGSIDEGEMTAESIVVR